MHHFRVPFAVVALVCLIASPLAAAPKGGALPTPGPDEVEAQVDALRGAAAALRKLADRPLPDGTDPAVIAEDQKKLRTMAQRLTERAGEMEKLLRRKAEWEAVTEEVVSVLHSMDDALDQISMELEEAKEAAPSEARRSFNAEAYAILEHL